MNEWISVKDRLPTELTYHSIYIVTMYSNLKNKSFVCPLHYIGDEWFEMIYEEPLDPEYVVTHWQPLPEPPAIKDNLTIENICQVCKPGLLNEAMAEISFPGQLIKQNSELTDMLCRLMNLLDHCEEKENTPWGYGYDKDLINWWKKHKQWDKDRIEAGLMPK